MDVCVGTFGLPTFGLFGLRIFGLWAWANVFTCVYFCVCAVCVLCHCHLPWVSLNLVTLAMDSVELDFAWLGLV